MIVSNRSGSKSVTFQVKTIQLWNINEESFPVFGTPRDDAKNRIEDANGLYQRIKNSIEPSENKWWAFVAVEDGLVKRYFVSPSMWVYDRAISKAREYLGIDAAGVITGIAKSGKNVGKLYTWGSLGVIGFYVSEFDASHAGLGSIVEALS